MWWIAPYYASSPPPAGQGFRKGANPFAKNSQEPLDILESITPAELANCVPYVKIEKVDRLGAAANSRPLMFDLIQAPRFGSGEDDFGLEDDVFMERSLVSLNNLTVEFEQQYGLQIFRQITMEFTVHHPAIVFDRASKVEWRQLLMPGTWFTLEYGWRADPTVVQNPLFNGDGHITESGQVLKPSQLIMLNIDSYTLATSANGEVKVTVKAMENGDLCMRMMRFSDAFESSIGSGFISPTGTDDMENVSRLRSLLERLLKKPVKGRGEYYTMGDILDNIVAPMVVSAAKLWGYDGVDLLLGKFNRDAGPQSDAYFGQPMADSGIENFKVPVNVLLDWLQGSHFSKGRSLFLQQFISQLINFMNGESAWGRPTPGKSYEQPNVLMKSETVQTSRGIRLVLIIHDIKTGSHPFGIIDSGQNRIAIEKQSKETQFEKLRSLGVPILEFARAGSLITDSAFNISLDPLLRSDFAERAYKDQKDRVQAQKMPDTESRKGQARNGELIMPISILEGEIQMHGNFALEVFGRIWIDYFGSKEISGCFSVRGKTDVLEAGTFRSTFKVISEGIDPLNTRRRLSEQELKEKDAADARKTGKKGKPEAGSHQRTNKDAPAPKPTGTVVTRGSTS